MRHDFDYGGFNSSSRKTRRELASNETAAHNYGLFSEWDSLSDSYTILQIPEIENSVIMGPGYVKLPGPASCCKKQFFIANAPSIIENNFTLHTVEFDCKMTPVQVHLISSVEFFPLEEKLLEWPFPSHELFR